MEETVIIVDVLFRERREDNSESNEKCLTVVSGKTLCLGNIKEQTQNARLMYESEVNAGLFSNFSGFQM